MRSLSTPPIYRFEAAATSDDDWMRVTPSSRYRRAVAVGTTRMFGELTNAYICEDRAGEYWLSPGSVSDTEYHLDIGPFTWLEIRDYLLTLQELGVVV